MTWKKKLGMILLSITSPLIVVIAILLLFHSEDSHHFHMKYRLWKLGWADYQPEYMRFLNVDRGLRESLVGDDLESVKRLFPDLRSKGRAIPYQAQYGEHLQKGHHYWLGDTLWTIEFRNDRLVEFHLWKG